MFCLFIACIAVAAAVNIVAKPSATANSDLIDCKYKRSEVMPCVEKYADLNGDREIDAHEIDVLERALLTPFERIGTFFVTISHIMSHCDVGADGKPDGKISEADFERSVDTCLATCKRVTMFFEMVCQRGERLKYVPPRNATAIAAVTHNLAGVAAHKH